MTATPVKESDRKLSVVQTNQELIINGINVTVCRKYIKYLHLRVYPPDGQVRMSVPIHVSDDEVRSTVVSKLDWIHRKRQQFKELPERLVSQYESGECHDYFGESCTLEVVERSGKREIILAQPGCLFMFVQPGTNVRVKARLLDEWYREALKHRLPDMVARWQPVIGVQVSEWKIRKMISRWGTCNISQQRICVNLELAKRPPECLEYVLVHEMVHLLERYHNARFKGFMDRFMPDWRRRKEILNKTSLLE